MLAHGASVDDVDDTFSWLEDDQFEEYRDATFSDPGFRLTLADCWRALDKGRLLGWIARPTANGFCGVLDMLEYANYENPLNGDLHEVVPEKLIAFVGPHDLGGDSYRDDARGLRRFSPAFFADLFADRGVAAVVRLNERSYDESAFAQRGIAFLDLPFGDCTPPPPHVAAAFLAAVAASPGPVAVHCKAGLGRTGTLIALHLMRSHAFSAREAVGWLRVMRPGSVIGEQQAYLCAMERAGLCRPDVPVVVVAAAAAAAALADGVNPARSTARAAEAAEAAAAEVWAACERRGAERARA